MFVILFYCLKALQAPACHENMVKVAGYILGEFGNLIAGDQRSSPIIQFQLLHSKYHLCSVPTRALLLTTYVKFINLFPEIRGEIQSILKLDSNIRSSNAELQQRTVEYLQLSQIAAPDLLATVLEEMPPFPERESSILAILKKKKPGMREVISNAYAKEYKGNSVSNNLINEINGTRSSNASTDLLGLNASSTAASMQSSSLLVDVFDNFTSSVTNSTLHEETSQSSNVLISNAEGLKKLVCKNNGVLFENDLIQIGVKCEFRQNLGRLSIFYGNKTNFQLQNFLSSISCPGNLSRGEIQYHYYLVLSLNLSLCFVFFFVYSFEYSSKACSASN